ncbi:acid protease, partial [Sistotremastrum niveocremeum HHB9708]
SSPVVEVREPIIPLPIARRIAANGIRNLVEHDKARAKHLISKGKKNLGKRVVGPTNVLEVDDVVSYVASVGVGTPATTYTCLIDTGSSNLWIGALKKYTKTSSSKCTGTGTGPFSVEYGSGSVSGSYCFDTVTLAPTLVIKNQAIGIASSAQGFSGVDGILGLGPADLTEGTVSGLPATTNVATVMDNLLAQKLIPTEVLGVSFEPTNSTVPVTNGELTYGGTDSSRFTGSLVFTPITTTSPASEFWGINQAVAYGTTTILSSTAGIVDTGTTLLLIATDAYKKYVAATGAKLDQSTGLLKITAAQFAALSNVVFTIQGTQFVLTPNAQIWPRTLNTDIGGTAGSIYLIIGDLGTPSGEGLDFINGFVWLQRFYAVFDTTNKRFGVANTPFTNAIVN